MAVEGALMGADLRSLQLDAYTKVVRCFMQGPYDLAKEEALSVLRQALHISNDDHLQVRMDLRAEQQQQQGGAKRGPQLQPASSAPPSPSFALSSHPSGASPQLLYPQQASRQPPAGGKGGSGSSKAAGAAGGSASRKRLKGEGGNAAKPPRQRGSAAGAAPAAAQLGDIDPLVGRKVMRYWPRDGGWFNGIISDYNRSNGEHCIVYDFGLPSESYEWYNIEAADPEEFQLLQGRADITSLPGIQAQQQPAAAAAARKAPAAQQGQQRAAGAAAAVAAGRGGGWLPGQARAAGQQQQQQQLGAAGGYRLAGAPKPGQRLPVVARPRLPQDWSSEEEDEEGGRDQEWGPRHRDVSAAYSDASG